MNLYHFEKIRVTSRRLQRVRVFLEGMGLGIDSDVELFVAGYWQGEIAAVGGLAGNTIKSVAVSPSHQGTGLSSKLLTELVTHAYDLGRYNLFIYTKPENYPMFREAGFYMLTSVKDRVVLLENSRHRLSDYCNGLTKLRQPGNKIGCIVMNANPFTKGHRYLVEYAASQCDWLHLFVVKEDRSYFSYQERMKLIRAGAGDLPNVTIHPGSDYMISRATFPSYFIKDEGVINYCHTAVDLQLFRNHIAPALGVTHRFVGTEPICAVTNFYNQQMHQWLSTPVLPGNPISLVEVPRCEIGEAPVSASLVRKLLTEKNWAAIRPLVPDSTYQHLLENYYVPDPEPVLRATEKLAV